MTKISAILVVILAALHSSPSLAITWELRVYINPVAGEAKAHSYVNSPGSEGSDYNHVRAYAEIYEEGSFVTSDLCKQTRASSETIACLASAADTTPTDGCEYCNDEDVPSGKSWVRAGDIIIPPIGPPCCF
jgi:hypothetical protein